MELPQGKAAEYSVEYFSAFFRHSGN